MKHHLCIFSTVAVLSASTEVAEQSDDFKALLDRMDHVTYDYAAAIDKAQPLADAGQPRGLMLIGVMYEQGLCLPADPAKALEYYRKAADQGYPQAIRTLPPVIASVSLALQKMTLRRVSCLTTAARRATWGP